MSNRVYLCNIGDRLPGELGDHHLLHIFEYTVELTALAGLLLRASLTVETMAEDQLALDAAENVIETNLLGGFHQEVTAGSTLNGIDQVLPLELVRDLDEEGVGNPDRLRNRGACVQAFAVLVQVL